MQIERVPATLARREASLVLLEHPSGVYLDLDSGHNARHRVCIFGT